MNTASAPAPAGRLLVVPNALDFGVDDSASLASQLSTDVLACAARLQHWRVENARSARAFLKRVGLVMPLAQPLQALDIVELPRPDKGARAGIGELDWAPLLAPARQGADVGLLSEAGLAGVADPGAALVAAAHAAGIMVQVLPGASAVTLALAASGLNGQRFGFEGYLPQDPAARAERIQALEQSSAREARSIVAIETPYRNPALFDALLQHLRPDTHLAVALALCTPRQWCGRRSVAAWRSAPPVLPTDAPAVFLWQAAAMAANPPRTSGRSAPARRR